MISQKFWVRIAAPRIFPALREILEYDRQTETVKG